MIKRWKLLSFISAFTLSLLLCFTSTSDVNALVIGNGSALNFTSGTIHNGSDNTYIAGTLAGSDLVFNIPAGDKTIDRLVFNFSTASGTSPNFLFTFNARFQGTSAQNGFEILDGILGSNMDVYALDCVNVNNNPAYSGGSVVANQGNQTTTCSYLVFSHGNYTQFESHESSRIVRFYSQVADSSKIILTPGTLRHLAFDGLTVSDREWLAANMPTGVSQVEIDEIQSKIEETTSAVNDLRLSQEQGNEEAQDRWEADKQEEADREEQGSEDMDDLTSTFNFEIRNPFAGLLTMFTNNCPVNIPIIAGMVGATSSVYPCWFSQQTRSILTPVFGLSSSMLLFGYIVRKFLNGTTFNDTMEF